jgi:hypothetical protein
MLCAEAWSEFADDDSMISVVCTGAVRSFILALGSRA